jgi:hypothetical protein
MRTALIAIGRRENLYAREFVEHYQKLGFDNVIILDNNYGDEEHFEDVLQDYVDQGFVIVENYRDKTRIQMKAYTEMYAKYKDQYDWLAFFDFDEFLILEWHNTIDEYLEKFPTDCEVVLVNWLCMTDNNLVHYDDRPLMERFTEPMPLDRCVQYNFPDNCHVKSIIRGGLNAVFGGNPHTTDTPLKAYNSVREKTENRPWQPMNYTMAYLKHFTTKTIEEWMTRKMKVGTPDREPSQFLPFYEKRFFKINELTKEKLDYLDSIDALNKH